MTAYELMTASFETARSDWVTQLRAGDSAATAAFVEQHGPRIQRLCGRLIGWHHDADDLAQDVFVLALERVHTYRGEGSLDAWLSGIAVRVCRKWVRRQSLRRRLMHWFPGTRTLEAPSNQALSELQDEVRAGLMKLSPTHREILVLRYLEHWEVNELMEMLRLPRSAVDQRLSRARKQLAHWLGENDDT